MKSELLSKLRKLESEGVISQRLAAIISNSASIESVQKIRENAARLQRIEMYRHISRIKYGLCASGPDNGFLSQFYWDLVDFENNPQKLTEAVLA